MELTQAIICIIAAFILGVALCVFVIWLIIFGIPSIKAKRWNKFEEDVVYVVKKNFDKYMTINKNYIKDLMKEIEDEQKKQ